MKLNIKLCIIIIELKSYNEGQNNPPINNPPISYSVNIMNEMKDTRNTRDVILTLDTF